MKNPAAVQLGDKTARSLIDVDSLAAQVIKQREERKVGPVDIRKIDVFYDIQVLPH
ncbi:MAG TPA: hypothetical protein VN081_04205 [Dongiaceae bacterium]|nr:hypothetical protein [Dongiaceae bacterium]